MLLFKLAVLNIGRNPRRSVITVLAVGVGLASLIFLWGFNDGTIEQMRENVIRLFTGHFQIHARGFEKNLAAELFIPRKEALLERLRSDPEIVSVAERVKCEALVGTSENSRGVLLIGIDPAEELRVTQLHTHLREGSFLAPSDSRAILLGHRLAEKIRVNLDDKVVVMTQAVDGTLAGFAYRVKGIFHTGSQQIDELTAYISLASGRELLGMENETHEIAVRLKGRNWIEPVVESLSGSLSREDYEIIRWNEIVPEVDQWTEWAQAVISTILMAVMVVIGVSIMNTILMSTFERTRELGVMLAIGTSPLQIISLILLETLVLQFFGILVGLLGGYLVTFYFGQVGISFHGVEEAFSMSYMSTVIYTRVEPGHVIQSIATLVLLTSVISLYPAWRAGRMAPVKAIYQT